MDKKEMLKYTGTLQQLAYTRACTIQEGRANGLRAVEVKNDDLRFLVLADKCLDVGALEYKGMTLSFTAKPGLIIGKDGAEVNKLKEELCKISGKDVQINIYEVKRPDLDATIVANNIARQLEGRVAYRRAVKLALSNAQRNQAEGIKIQVSGRLNGAEMTRKEMFKEGRTPLHTFRADIDYCLAEAHTKMGVIGVKVWICRGEVYGKRDLTQPIIDKGQKPASDRDNGFRGDRRPRGRRNNNQQR